MDGKGNMPGDRERDGVRASGPLVSVVVPCYNAGAFIDEALWSLRHQTLEPIEIIVVDDGSVDKSPAIAARHAAADPRVRTVTQANAGAAAARNRGMAEARAPWIAFLDSDDVAEPPRLERQLAFVAEHPTVALTSTYGLRIGSRGRELGVVEIGPLTLGECDSARIHNEVVVLLTSSVMVSREVALGVGGFRDLYGSEDADMWTRIADRHDVLVLPKHLVRYRMNQQGLSSSGYVAQCLAGEQIRFNTVRRRAGRAEVDAERFAWLLSRQPLARRLRRHLDCLGRMAYRQAGTLLADRDVRGIAWLYASYALGPAVPIRGIARSLLPWLLRRRER